MIDAPFELKHRFDLPDERKIQLGWFGIAPEWFPENDNDHRSLGKTKEAHGTLCKIKSDNGKAYRVVRSAGTGQIGHEYHDCSNEILLDYQGRIELAGEQSQVEGEEVDLKILPATYCESVCFLLDHPDPAYRAARWPAIVAVVLSVIGIVLSVFSLSSHLILTVVMGVLVFGAGLYLLYACS